MLWYGLPLTPRPDAYVTSHLGFRPINVSSLPAASSSGPVLIDPEAMPFACVPRTVGVVGEASTAHVYIIRRYREDPNDGPEGRYNIDTFKAWVGSLPSRLDHFDRTPQRLGPAGKSTYGRPA